MGMRDRFRLAGWFGIKRAALGTQKGWRRETRREIRGEGGGGEGEGESARGAGQWWPRLEIRKEINSAIDKRPVKRQSAPVWVDEALSILDKKHNRRYPGDIERARLLCLPFFRLARIFFSFLAEKSSRCRSTRCNARDLFRFVSPLLPSLSLSLFLPLLSLEGLRNFATLPIEISGQELFPTVWRIANLPNEILSVT